MIQNLNSKKRRIRERIKINIGNFCLPNNLCLLKGQNRQNLQSFVVLVPYGQ